MSALKHLPALDGLRGIAIGLVLAHHLFVFEPLGGAARYVNSLIELASHGVDIFFVLSGFLISRQLSTGAQDPGFTRRFWLHRGAKILPLYLLVVGGVFVGLRPLLEFAGQNEKLSWLVPGQASWPWYVFLLSNLRNALDGRFTNPAIDVSWSLAVEVQFYLLAFTLTRNIPVRHWPRLALLTVAAAIVFRSGLALTDANWIQILVLTPGRLDAFALGAIAAVAPRWLEGIPRIILIAVAAVPVLLPWSRDSLMVETVGYTLVALMAGITIQRAAEAKLPGMVQRVLTCPTLATLGRISYSIFLTHVPLRAVLRDSLLPVVRTLDSPTAWGLQIAFMAGAGFVCIAMGWLTWRFFEEPVRRAVLARLEVRIAPLGAGHG